MKITVIETGSLNEPLLSRWGSYPAIFEGIWARPGDEWQSWDCAHQPPPADLLEQDAIIITGSAADAHSNLAWILQLKLMIVSLHERRIKILGICFGHQVVAGALGGSSGRNEKGWELAMHPISLTEEYSNQTWGSTHTEFHIIDIHRDHVTRMPPGAKLMASTEHTPVSMFCLEDNVLCLQSHPEFNKELIADVVISVKESRGFSDEVATAALNSLKSEHQNTASRELVSRFLYG